MKKGILAGLLLALGVGSGQAQTLYDDFETTPGGTRLVTYARQTGTLIQNQMNPGTNAVDMSPTCARYVRNAGIQYDNFDVETPRMMDDVTPYINNAKRISMKFYSPAPGTQVLLVLQNKAKNRSGGYPAGKLLGEFTASTTLTNAWETLTFTFNAVGPGNFDPTVTVTTVDEITVLIAPNTFLGTTYHFDDLYGPELTAPAPPSTVTAQTYDDFEYGRRVRYLFNDGSFSPGISNPAPGGTNTSAVVSRFVRDGGIAYNTISLAPANATFLDDISAYASTSATLHPTIKVYSPAAGIQVQMVMANAAKRAAGGNAWPIGTHSLYLGTTSVANQWETITLNYVPGGYDGSVKATEIDRIDLQIAPGTSNAGTFYLDDIIGPTVTRPVARLYENFNDTRVLTYGPADGTLTQQATNPSLTGLNPNPRVGKYDRTANIYDTFYADLPGPADDVADFASSARQMTMLVYSPAPVGTDVVITLLDNTATPGNYPTGRHSYYSAQTTAQNAWQRLTFSNPQFPSGVNGVRNITKVAIQFAGPTTTAGTWYFDQLYGPNFTVATGTLYDDFEGTRQLSYTTSNGATLNETFTNQSPFDANFSSTAGHYVRSAVPYDALTLTPTGGKRLSNVTAYASTAATRFFYLKVFSKTPGTPVQLVLQNAAKAANGYPNGNQSIYNATTTKSNQWELLQFAYQAAAPGVSTDATVSVTQVNQLVLLFNPGNATAGQVYDFDFMLGQDLVLATGLTWNGSVSSDWNDGDNWSGGTAPVATPGAPAIVPGGLSRYPILTTGNTYGAPDIIVNAGGSITQTGGTFNLSAGVTNNGTYSQTGGTTVLSGTAGHVFGNGQPILFNELVVGSGGMVLAGGPQGTVSVKRRMVLDGNVTTNGKLILLSDASGTAMVVHRGSATTSGSVTVQRYLDPSLNPGTGYRHLAASVDGQTVADLHGPGGSAPVVNPAYNAAAQPGTVTPFPTVFTYNEQRLTAASGTSSSFDFGWQSPSLSDGLAAGQGYTVNLEPTTLTFTGALRTGNYAVALSRGATANSGWHLLGNPYAAPINWDSLARPTGVDNAVYTFRSNSQYGGSYQAYVNGMGPSGANMVAQGQAFFTRVMSGTPTFTFTNAARVTTYASPVQYRGTADLRPRLELAFAAANGAADLLYVYQETGASAAFDSHYDALKVTLNGGTQPSLYQQAGSESLSIQGLPTGTQPVALPLGVHAPTAGTFTFEARQLANFPAGTSVQLLDTQTGRWYDLQAGPATLALPAGLQHGRFVLHLYAQRALATTGALAGSSLLAYPNPAQAGTLVRLSHPAASGEVLSLTGRVVGTFTNGQLRTTGLAAGVYVLRNTATGERSKLVIE